jgi:hypothetical protein
MADHQDRHDPALERLLGPTGYEIGCEECFAKLDEYVELEVGGADADERIPGMRAHLHGCPACESSCPRTSALSALGRISARHGPP